MAETGSSAPVRVCVAGLGLIGGSVALAAKRAGAEVYGSDPDPAAMVAAVERGAIEAAELPDPPDFDVIVVAAPVGALAETIASIAARHPEAIVTDVGSTKASVATGAPNYIGGHPLAGAEVAGIEHARADLFDGATWFLTPHASSDGVKLDRLHRLIAQIGAKPVVIDAGEHDRLMAAFSHLPHVVANALALGGLAALGEQRQPVVGPSFRDATRVAGANPELWAGIYAANRDALAADLDRLIERLTEARGLVAAGDPAALADWQQAAADAREALADHGRAGGPVEEIRVIVPNRPGVVADLTLTLARAGINIQDLSLQPAADNRSGEVALWVPSEDAGQARALVNEVVSSE